MGWNVDEAKLIKSALLSEAISPEKEVNFFISRLRVVTCNRIVVKLILIILVITAVESEGNSLEQSEQWKNFTPYLSIFGLVAGESQMTEVTKLMGAQKWVTGHGHEPIRLCYKSPDSKIYLVFLTHYLHDSDTLYGYEVSMKPTKDKRCPVSQKLTEPIAYMNLTEAELIKFFGKPKRNMKSNELTWEIQFHEVYPKPKIKTTESGPSDARKQEKYILKGEYHYVTIKSVFEGKKLTRWYVFHGGEADFEIQ